MVPPIVVARAQRSATRTLRRGARHRGRARRVRRRAGAADRHRASRRHRISSAQRNSVHTGRHACGWRVGLRCSCDARGGCGGACSERAGGNDRREARTIVPHVSRCRRGSGSSARRLSPPRPPRRPHRWWLVRTPLRRGAARALPRWRERTGARHASCLFTRRRAQVATRALVGVAVLRSRFGTRVTHARDRQRGTLASRSCFDLRRDDAWLRRIFHLGVLVV